MWFMTVTNATVTVIVFFHDNVTTVITAVKLPREALNFSRFTLHNLETFISVYNAAP